MTRKSIPVTKLTPPNSNIKTRKPTRPSERCGVSVAEKMVGSRSSALSGVIALTIPKSMTRKPTRKAPAKHKTKSRTGKRAKVKPAPKRAAADIKAAQGALPQWTTAQIAEAFSRFKAANPEPKGELQHINPFTLLVAVVLSAQATDAGVNKATPALFALADTPEKMAALGETRVRDLIKTIGLFRTKAKNVVALSQKLIAEHGSQVPRSREALEALRWCRPQDRQRRPQHRFRRANDCCRYAHLSRRKPHRTGNRQNPARS